MEGQKEKFEKQGFNVAAVSYDSVETLKHFSDRKEIRYPLLADKGSKVIRAFGILNDQWPSDIMYRKSSTGERDWIDPVGIAYPGNYLIDPQGIIQSKYFYRKFFERQMSAGILVREFGTETDSPRYEAKTDHLKITASASNSTVGRGNHIELVLDVQLNPGIHVYAPDVEGGYKPIQWKMVTSRGLQTKPVEYPPSRMLHLPVIDETVPVYEGSFRMIRGVTIGDGIPGNNKGLNALLNEKQEVVIESSFQYQACDDEMCYIPVNVPLKWTFKLWGGDIVRVPEELRERTGP